MFTADLETPRTCPICGWVSDHVSSPTAERLPQPGDVAICVGCSGLNVYTENQGLRLATAEELVEFSSNPFVMRALALLEVAKARQSARQN